MKSLTERTQTLQLNDCIQRLEHAGINNAKQEVLWLISDALGVSHSEIFSRQSFSDYELSKIEAVISRREKHEPLQYILGEADFYGRDFHVGSGVLVPRHDTETLIDAVKKIFAPDKKFCFLDWGTGSGCIAITILLEFTNSFAFMLENNLEAINYALKNLSRYNLIQRVLLLENIFEKVHESYINTDRTFDMIISNPPYIPSNEILGLAPEVRDYEPHSALDGGEEGMNFYAQIFSQAKETLRPGGYVIIETGNVAQVQKLKNFYFEFEYIDEVLDAGNFPRCLIFRRKEGFL